MKRFRSLSVLLVIAALVGLAWGATARPVNAQIIIPTGATINSATLWLYGSAPASGTVRVHRITAPWTELAVTWNNFAGSYDANVVDSFVASGTGWFSADVTALVQDWIAGVHPDYGFLLEQDPDTYTIYQSSESSSLALRPKLEICVTLADSTYHCVTIQRPGADLVDVRDAYIWEPMPDLNRGYAPELYTGWFAGGVKQALLQFDFEFETGSGCSLTPGYWKTHSSYGPAPYDATWAQVGENSPFFLSGQSWYQVLWTQPAGNAYYILAHAYIAAYLNGLNGADTSAVAAQLSHAATLLSTYAPTTTLTKAVRQDFVSTAGVLDAYNNGYIGPGHCVE